MKSTVGGQHINIESIKERARELKRESVAVYLACRDRRTPWHARVLAAIVVAYAFSPIDLIPDFIPVLGYLDDLVLVPLGIWLVVRMIPEEVMQDARQKAASLSQRPTSRTAAVVIVLLWILALAWLVWLLGSFLHPS